MTADAGWSYYCQPVGQADINNLMAELQKAGAPAGGGGGVGIGLPGRRWVVVPWSAVAALPRVLA